MVDRFIFFCFFQQNTAYWMRISDWSADVCASDLLLVGEARQLSIAAIQNMPPDHQRKAQWRPPPRGIVVIRGTGEQAAYHAGEGHRIGRHPQKRELPC